MKNIFKEWRGITTSPIHTNPKILSPQDNMAIEQYNAKAQDYFLNETPLQSNWKSIVGAPYGEGLGKRVAPDYQQFEFFKAEYRDLYGNEKMEVDLYKDGPWDKIDTLKNVSISMSSGSGNEKLALIIKKDQKGVFYVDRRENKDLSITREIKYHKFGMPQETDKVIHKKTYAAKKNFAITKYIDTTADSTFLFNRKVFISNDGTVYKAAQWQPGCLDAFKKTLRDSSGVVFTKGSSSDSIRLLVNQPGRVENTNVIQTIRSQEIDLTKGDIFSSKPLINVIKEPDGTYKLTSDKEAIEFKNNHFEILKCHPHKSGKIILECVADTKDIIVIYNEETQEIEKKITSLEANYSLRYERDFYNDDIIINYNSTGNNARVKIAPDQGSVIAWDDEDNSTEISIEKNIEFPAPQLDNIVSEKIFVKTRDGVEVPVLVIYDKSLVKFDGSNPMHVESYASYGINSPLKLDVREARLIEKGFIHTVVEARGSAALGSAWHKAATGANKENTTNDIMDAIKYMIAQKYTSVGNISLEGSSAGGFNVATLINKHPEYFKAAILHNPRVTIAHNDEEFLDPKNLQEELARKNPIDNIKPANYPAIYVKAAVQDIRTSVEDTLKYVEKLEQNNTGDAPIILEVEWGAGHFVNSSHSQYDLEIKELSFLEAQFNISVTEEV